MSERVWAALAKRVDTPSEGDEADVWAALDSRLDRAGWRPALGDWVELRRFELPWNNSYAVIGNLRDLLYYKLTPAEADLVDLFDGTRTLAEIAVEQLTRSGELELSSVAELADLLYSGGYLVDRYIDADEALAKSLNPVPLRRAKLREFVKTLSIEWHGAERLVKASYRWGLRWVFTRIGMVVAALVVIAGFVAFGVVVVDHGFHFTAQSVGIGFVVLFALNLAIVFIHELGHALVLVHYGRRVKSAGFRIYFGSPAFFVDSSDALLMSRGQRIGQAFAGPAFEMITSGVAAMALWAFPTMPLSSTLYRFVLLNYFVSVHEPGAAARARRLLDPVRLVAAPRSPAPLTGVHAFGALAEAGPQGTVHRLRDRARCLRTHRRRVHHRLLLHGVFLLAAYVRKPDLENVAWRTGRNRLARAA